MELQTIAFITEYSGVIGCPGNKRKLGSKMTKRTWKFKKCAKLNKMDHGGYSLVELMVVVVIMVILASVRRNMILQEISASAGYRRYPVN